MKRLAMIGIVVVILGLGAYALWSNGAWSHTTPASSGTGQGTDTIIFDGSSFTPLLMTVPAGTTITVKNTSSQLLDFDSDPHPVHTDDSDLNLGQINPGQSKTLVAHKKGTFGYHNHLDPGAQGKITVE